MAELATIARPYAEAVFELAKETDHFEQWSEQLGFLTAIVEDTAIKTVMGNPQVDKKTLTHLLLAICAEQIDTAGQNLVRLLIDNHRLAITPQLTIQYEQLKADYQQRIPVQITSSHAVTPAQQQAIEATLKARLGKTVDLNVILDESLIGGWLIHAGDEVIDLSIKGRLQQLANELRS